MALNARALFFTHSLQGDVGLAIDDPAETLGLTGFHRKRIEYPLARFAEHQQAPIGEKYDPVSAMYSVVEELSPSLTSDSVSDRLQVGGRRKGALHPNARERVAGTLIQQALDGNTTTCIFFLKCQAGWKETTRSEVEATVEQRHPESELLALARRELRAELTRLGPEEFARQLAAEIAATAGA